MISFSEFVCLLLLAVVPRGTNSCLETNSIKDFAKLCAIRNLTVISTSVPGKMQLSNETSCNASIPVSWLSNQPEVYFTPSHQAQQHSNSTYLLLAFDATSSQLLWAISNISGFWNDSISSSSSKLKPYAPVSINPAELFHEIVFMVFEEKPNNLNTSVIISQNDKKIFNLTSWLSRQIISGNKLCGPVAATQLAVYADKAEKGSLLHLNPAVTLPPHSTSYSQPPHSQPHPHPTYPQPSNPQQSSYSPPFHPSTQAHPHPSNSSQLTTHHQILNSTLPPVHHSPNTTNIFSLSTQPPLYRGKNNTSKPDSKPSKQEKRNSGVNIKSNFPGIIFLVLFATFKIIW